MQHRNMALDGSTDSYWVGLAQEKVQMSGITMNYNPIKWQHKPFTGSKEKKNTSFILSQQRLMYLTAVDCTALESNLYIKKN